MTLLEQTDIIQTIMSETLRIAKEGGDKQELVNLSVWALNRLQGYDDDGKKEVDHANSK